MGEEIINWPEYSHARKELGDAFIRILGYFRDDGTESVGAIEEAMRVRSAVDLIIPAHTLKGESRQFGAQRLADMAEKIEMVARRCVEYREGPEELMETVAELRACFLQTLTELEDGISPVVKRKQAAFGRKAVGNTTLFGRS